MIRAILTDIEGTTTSTGFVYEVLFPYARQHIAEFVRNNAGDPRVAAHLEEMRKEAGADLDLEGVIAQLIEWIDADAKITPLKALQGLLWEEGFRNGIFAGHVYPDAVTRLERWNARGILLYVYSSGSVQAQQLLFAHTDAGDLTPLFSGYYDTRTGGKREPATYTAIAADIGLPPQEILFLSDTREELDAARAAGMRTTWLVRDATPDPAAAHTQVSDFSAIELPED